MFDIAGTDSHFRPADRGHKDVGFPRNVRKVFRLRVAYGDSRVPVKEKHGEWSTYQITAVDYDCFGACDLHLVMLQESRNLVLPLGGHKLSVHYCGSHSTSKTLLSFTVNIPSVNRRTASGYSRCSSRSIRWLNVSTVSSSRTGTGVWRIIGPVSTPLSTKWTVQPVTLAP